MRLARCIEAELRFSDRALARELDRWRNETAENDPVFKVHRSQIVRICRTLECARETLGLCQFESLASADADTLLSGLRTRREHAQSLHLVWNFFREKLLQRVRPEFQAFLRAADDLAWACYRPFLERLEDQEERDGLREPPLVFLSLEPAPFAQARGSSFAPRGLSSRQMDRLYKILRMLPVPIIGLPWLQVGHFPDLCLVGHETAHIVADDLELERDFPALVASIEAIDQEREPMWTRWFDEVFADIMGVLACGAGYGAALTRALASDRSSILVQEPDPRGAYPPRRVRVLLAQKTAQVLGEMGHAVSTRFVEDWDLAYGAAPDDAFARDVEPLVRAVLGHRFARLGGATLAEVLPPPNERKVREYVDAAIHREALPERLDIRCAMAAAALSYLDDKDAAPDTTDDTNHASARRLPYRRLVEYLAEKREDGHRAADGEFFPKGTALGAGHERAERARVKDDRVGRDIASLFDL